jgi:predicted porin
MATTLVRGTAAALASLLAVSAAPCLAQSTQAAPSSVTLYGIVDVAVERINNVGVNGDSLTRVASLTGMLPSRVGLRGSEDLGGGLRAVFTLENGFAPDQGTSNQGGRLFGRQAWVGLARQWGQVAVGRQVTALFWSLLDADIMGPALYSSGSLDAYIPNARADNAVGYLGRFGGLTLGATYSFGRDAVNAGPGPAGTNCPGESPTDSKACREWSALLKYDSSTFGVAAAIDMLRGGPAAFAGLTRSDLTDTRVVFNGYAKFGPHKLAAGIVRRDNEGSLTTPRSDLLWLGGAAVFGKVTLEAQVFKLDFKGSDNGALLPVVRGSYRFSRRTAVYATAANIDNKGASAFSVSGGGPGGLPVPGGSQTGIGAGILHSF